MFRIWMNPVVSQLLVETDGYGVVVHPPVKQGTPTDEELEGLCYNIGESWKKIGRRLGIDEAQFQIIHRVNDELSQLVYHTLRHWKEEKGSAATYEALSDALKHLQHQDLAGKFCYSDIKQGTPTDEELEELCWNIGESWKIMGRRLGIDGEQLRLIHQINDELSEMGYHILRHWKEEKGSAATYEALSDAFNLVQRRNIAEKVWYSDMKQGTPTDEELGQLCWNIRESWKIMGRRLGIDEAQLQTIHRVYHELSEIVYHMLRHWKEEKGSAATYEALSDAPNLVQRQDLGEKFWYSDSTPTDDKVEELCRSIGESWKIMGRRLGIDEAQLQIRHRIYDELPEMGQCMLRYWKGEKGSAATLQPGCDCDASKLVQRRDSVEEFCYRDLKQGTPSDDELEKLCWDIGESWKLLGRCLGINETKLQRIQRFNDELSEMRYHMLRHWKKQKGSAATYKALCNAFELVQRRDLAEEFHYSDPIPGWKQGELLGAGASGKVYECFPTWPSMGFRGRRAVKKVKIEPQYTEMSEEVKALRNEINILMKLRHKRIVSFYGSEEKDGYLHLFMDFMAGGSLSDHIKNRKVLFENESRRYTKQILEGVSFLHEENIIHRDIKGSNVLLDVRGDVKLADFGLSKIIQKIGSKTDLASHCGTPHWMAPEIIRGEGYGRKADIWSVGCTVVEMLTGRPPLGHLEPVAAIFEIGSNPTVPTLPEGVSQDAKDFIQAALTPNPLERPWSGELLRHNFVLDSTDW